MEASRESGSDEGLKKRQDDAMVQLQASIDAMPRYEKEDYLRAVEVAPDLVASESDPLKYLLCRNFNAAAAAQSLVRYWQHRVEIFGEDKAFLPMVITGDESQRAISDKVIEDFMTGRFVFLPNDQEGRIVFCMDPSRLIESDEAIRNQASFYVCQVISDHEISQEKGHVLIVLMTEFRWDKTHSQNIARLPDAFPIKAKAWHLVSCIPRWNKSCLAQAFVTGMMRMFGTFIRQRKYYVHTFTEKDEILGALQSHGLRKEGLPGILGGSWKYEQISDWLTDRALGDRQRCREYLQLRAKMGQSTSHDDAVSTQPNGGSSRLDSSEPLDKEAEKVKFFDTCVNFVKLACEKLSEAETNTYREARDFAASEVWSEESNRRSFLRVEDCNAWFAARRLTRYWDLRNESFGDARFKRLHQTGDGALGRKDLQELGTRFTVLLDDDANGCPVLWIDATKLSDSAAPSKNKARDCCLFYMLSLLAENEMSQTEGAVLLYNIGPTGAEGIDIKYLERASYSLPIRFKALHIISLDQAESSALESQVGGFCDEVHTHEKMSKDQVVSRLEACQIKKSGLPSCLGGPWGYGKFIQWSEFRTRMEFRIPLGYRGREMDEAYDFPAIRRYTFLPPEQKSEQLRRSNVIHCRRKRDRKLMEAELLREQCAELREEQRKLQEENDRLESLWKSARAMVNQEEKEETESKACSAPPMEQPLPRHAVNTSESSVTISIAETSVAASQQRPDLATTALSPSNTAVFCDMRGANETDKAPYQMYEHAQPPVQMMTHQQLGRQLTLPQGQLQHYRILQEQQLHNHRLMQQQQQLLFLQQNSLVSSPRMEEELQYLQQRRNMLESTTFPFPSSNNFTFLQNTGRTSITPQEQHVLRQHFLTTGAAVHGITNMQQQQQQQMPFVTPIPALVTNALLRGTETNPPSSGETETVTVAAAISGLLDLGSDARPSG